MTSSQFPQYYQSLFGVMLKSSISDEKHLCSQILFPWKKVSVTDVFFVFPNFQWLLSTFSRGAIIIAGPTNLCVVENQWLTSMREWFLLLTVSTVKCHDSKKSLLLQLATIWGSEHLLDWCNQLTQQVVWLPLLLIRPVSWLVLS